MGLDITAYRQVRAVHDVKVDEDGYPVNDGQIRVHKIVMDSQERDWPGRAKGIQAIVYEPADSLSFRAGAYSGYNEWRRELSRRAGHGDPKRVWEGVVTAGPFIELINFSDCEGVIGPVVSAKLARDFAEHEAKILASAEPWFADLYHKWRKAFEMAADGGFVDFH
jgi:hypothetical protein